MRMMVLVKLVACVSFENLNTTTESQSRPEEGSDQGRDRAVAQAGRALFDYPTCSSPGLEARSPVGTLGREPPVFEKC